MRLLGRLNRFTLAVTAILLAILVWTGFRQNSLMDRYNSTVEESERTIFLYATIREQTTEALLSRNSSALLFAAKEFEQFNERYMALLDNRFIPSQYKLTFLKDLDLEMVVVNLRNLAERLDDTDEKTRILRQLRQINMQFVKFDRIVVNEMKNKVVQYQKWALVLMGMIIALICLNLLILYQRSVRPLLDLAEQLKPAMDDGDFVTLRPGKYSSAEINVLTSAFNQLLDLHEENGFNRSEMTQREAEIHGIVNEVINGLNGIINYAQILTDYFNVEEIDEEQRKRLHKIIESGEKSALILQNGFHLTDK